jgi:hypothetical protein
MAMAMVQLVMSVLAALFMLFVASFPWENLSPGETAEYDRLAYAAPVLVGLAVAMLVAVAKKQPRWATAALVGQVAIGLPIVSFALSKSDHSDGKLVIFAAGFVLAGLIAVIESHRSLRRG